MRNDETTVERNAKKEKDMSSEQNFKKSKVAKVAKGRPEKHGLHDS